MSRLHQNGPQAAAPGHLNVSGMVTDHPGARKVDMKIATRALQQPKCGLSAVAENSKVDSGLIRSRVRVMRTDVDCIQAHARLLKLALQALIHRFYLRFARHAPRNDRLVRNDNQQKPSLSQSAQRHRSSVQELYVFGPTKVPAFHVQRAVPIKEDSCPALRDFAIQ